MSLTRRDLLKWSMGAVAASAMPIRLANVFANEAAKKIPIGLQLYSLRDVAPKDVPGTLDAVATMGYQGVEFAGYYGLKADSLRKMLDKSGLKCCGTHTAIDTLTGDALKATVEFNKTLGNKYLIVPWMPPPTSIAAIMDMAKTFTTLAEKVKDSGMRVGYHAHGGDFQPVADRIPWEVLFTNAGPSVLMQLDTGNCLSAGVDPVGILRKFPHRSLTIHLKEFGGPEGAAVGEGKAPWKDIFEVCETTGDTEWYIVEQESSKSPLESVKVCVENLRKMGK
jgi:sugar phosphate isomerase/epimerase